MHNEAYLHLYNNAGILLRLSLMSNHQMTQERDVFGHLKGMFDITDIMFGVHLLYWLFAFSKELISLFLQPVLPLSV